VDNNVDMWIKRPIYRHFQDMPFGKYFRVFSRAKKIFSKKIFCFFCKSGLDKRKKNSYFNPSQVFVENIM